MPLDGFVVTYPHGLALKFRFREQANAPITQALGAKSALIDETDHPLDRAVLEVVELDRASRQQRR